MNLTEVYKQCFEPQLKGRYVCAKHLSPILNELEKKGTATVLGFSEEGLPIHQISFGKGPKRVLIWSQMHGNESTTTKALFDFLNFLQQNNPYSKQVQNFEESHTLLMIPLLNPDGAALYTRENSNGVDLNRDALLLTQAESRLLRKVFETFKPHLCLNLHDQRTIYGLHTGKPATISFLAPAADESRSVTDSRRDAMVLVAKMNHFLQQWIPGQVGRYDDTFNENCVGDYFQKQGTPTILFEAGHYQGDYEREKVREFLFYAFLALFDLVAVPEVPQFLVAYEAIPENNKQFRDVLLRNAQINSVMQDLAIQYTEVLQNDKIQWVPILDEAGQLRHLKGHLEMDLEGHKVLINSYENVFVNEKISTIWDKTSKKYIKFQ
ncbi:MAG TPA: M14 family metallopeptidase [Flavobacteriaceae bacterium]|nr:peptidase M14 [Flavobacteriaceae bacterium]MCB9213385.1 peptidase M14 [Alteromonas sp.]HPF10277.1 M14 family metallopeptidase [Flavobacteriaceae bacterium]HQU20723.1 M14 family metallopeptidase [Flavobacteriaceae bacterium]HQU64859.1 M14 family metallopeptidase [Flavobacteriaceae bacterium]